MHLQPHSVTFSLVRPSNISQLTTDDVIAAIRRLPDKQSDADPMPTTMLKQIADVLAPYCPYITQLFNRSLIGGDFPAVFKEAFITPIVKKPGPDTTEPGSYRPISNLPVLSKLWSASSHVS